MPVCRKKLHFSWVAHVATLTFALIAAGLSQAVVVADGKLAISSAYAVGNGRGNGGVGNGSGRGDANRNGGRSASNDHGGGANNSSHANGAAGRGSLNSARAAAEGLAHANDRSPPGALDDYMSSMSEYAAAVEDLIAAELARQEYLDGLPDGEDPDAEVVAELDRAVSEAQEAVEAGLNAAAEAFLDAANKDDQITEDAVEPVNAMLDGKSEGFTDPDGHIDDSADDLVEAINNL